MMFVVWLVILTIIVSVLATILISKNLERKRQIGNLRVDRSDPTESPYLFLELASDGMTKIRKYRTVNLKVRIENYISDE